MPLRSQFAIPEYYQTLSHELVHWTEQETRLNWDRAKPENSYALAELIAEIGGCFMVCESRLPSADELGNHISYLDHWLKAMQSDPKYIFKAAAQASKAVDFLLSFGRKPVETLEPVA